MDGEGELVGSWQGASFSWVWLNHRRSSSGLRDKNLATPVEIWTATTGPQRGLPAEFAEQSSGGSRRHVWSGGDWRGQRRAAVTLLGGSLAHSVPGWLRPSLSSQREEQEEEAWCKRSAFQTHPQGPSWASFNRFGEHCLVRCLLSCSIANPGLREESQAIADSWVVTAA